MSEPTPILAEMMPDLASPRDRLTVNDESDTPKWRVFEGPEQVRPGMSRETDTGLVWSVSPGEWTILGPRPSEGDVVDLTHVRTLFRLGGDDSPRLLAKLCALDLGDPMFPDGAAARTLLAGVATELIRHDRDGERSHLIVPSRSFGRYLYEVIADAGAEFGLGPL